VEEGFGSARDLAFHELKQVTGVSYRGLVDVGSVSVCDNFIVCLWSDCAVQPSPLVCAVHCTCWHANVRFLKVTLVKDYDAYVHRY